MLCREKLVAVATLLSACGSSSELFEKPSNRAARSLDEYEQDTQTEFLEHGGLAIPGEGLASFDEDHQLHYWHLSLDEAQTLKVEVSQRGTARGLDATLFVYGPLEAPEDDALLLADDDSGWGLLPRLEDIVLPAGSYLAIVGTYDGRGRGYFRLAAECTAGCEPAPSPGPVEPTCDEILLTSMQSCVIESVSNPDGEESSRLDEIVNGCSDAESVAPTRDALCEFEPRPAWCGVDFEAFWHGYARACATLLDGWASAEYCVFGSEFEEIPGRIGVYQTSSRIVESALALSPEERLQIVRAVQASVHGEVAGADEAIDATDDDEVIETVYWDESNREQFRAWTFFAGGNRYGRIFRGESSEVVATLRDGIVSECSVTRGLGSQSCETASDCGGLACNGLVDGVGLCVDFDTPRPDEGLSCLSSAMCAPGSLCTGNAGGGEGLCLPAWMWGRFSEPGPGELASEWSASVDVRGLATVSMDVRLVVDVDHPRPSDLHAWVVNPLGTESEVTLAFPSTGEVRGSGLAAIPSDEDANGVWSVRVVDAVSGSLGSLNSVTLEISSRWD